VWNIENPPAAFNGHGGFSFILSKVASSNTRSYRRVTCRSCIVTEKA